MKPKTASNPTRTASNPTRPNKQTNTTHNYTIHNENIKKENRYAGKNLMENYQLNPNSSKLSHKIK